MLAAQSLIGDARERIHVVGGSGSSPAASSGLAYRGVIALGVASFAACKSVVTSA